MFKNHCTTTPEQRAPEEDQADLRGDVRPQDELAGGQADARSDDARSDEPPNLLRRLRQVADLRRRQNGARQLGLIALLARRGFQRDGHADSLLALSTSPQTSDV
jgi:hypothetical protein